MQGDVRADARKAWYAASDVKLVGSHQGVCE
jgi:hypothetical protein